MIIAEITDHLENLAPLYYQEEYDNSGLLVGERQNEVSSILISLDVTEKVVEEAISKNCNLIISHHPVLFKPLKKLTGEGYVQRSIMKAIKNDIALYAIHTNLDNVQHGVSHRMAEQLELRNIRILRPKKNLLKKLIAFIPAPNRDEVLKALYDAGAGNIGRYSECSFYTEGTGTFKPGEGSNPSIGNFNQPEFVKESRVEVVFPVHAERPVLRALHNAHPYEKPAYDILAIENPYYEVGSGVIGELENAMEPGLFLAYLKRSLSLGLVRHTPLIKTEIKRVALCGGSGSFLLEDAIHSNADVFISSDFKYHEFFDAEGKILVADINHYEAEVFTKDLIYEYLKKKFANIALVLSNVKTNPISYL